MSLNMHAIYIKFSYTDRLNWYIAWKKNNDKCTERGYEKDVWCACIYDADDDVIRSSLG